MPIVHAAALFHLKFHGRCEVGVAISAAAMAATTVLRRRPWRQAGVALAASAAAVAEMFAGLRVWCEGLQVVDQNSPPPPTPPALTSRLLVAYIVANAYTYPANRVCTWGATLLQALVEKALSQKLHGPLVSCRAPSDAVVSTVDVVDVVLPLSVSEFGARKHCKAPSSDACVPFFRIVRHSRVRESKAL